MAENKNPLVDNPSYDQERIGFKFAEIKEKKRMLAAKADTVEYLFLGSSIMACALYSPAFSPTAFNLASQSADNFTALSLFQYWQPKLPALRAVFLEYCSFTPGHAIAKGNLVGVIYCSFYHYIYGFDYTPPNYTGKILDLAAQLDRQKIKQQPDCGGWIHAPEDIRTQDQKAFAILNHVKCFLRPPTELEHSTKLAQLVQSLGLRFYIVVCPHSAFYRNLVHRLGYGQDSPDNYAASIGVPCLNFYEHPDFQEKDFRDHSHHLDLDGAKRFCALLRAAVP